MKKTKQQPKLWDVDNLSELLQYTSTAKRRLPPKFNLLDRLKISWGVFIGAYDALEWED